MKCLTRAITALLCVLGVVFALSVEADEVECPGVYTFTGEALEDWFGESASGAGDVDNDGFDDVIVGWHDPCRLQLGVLYYTH